MSTTPQNTLQRARQGHPDAIAALMNQHLQAQGITAQVTQRGQFAACFAGIYHALAQTDLVAYVKKGVSGLSLDSIYSLEISGQANRASNPLTGQKLSRFKHSREWKFIVLF